MTQKINPGSHSKSPSNNGFFKLVEPLLQIHPCFFSHRVKLCAFQLSVVPVSLHYLPQMSAFNSHMRAKHLQLLTESLKLCCHVIATQQRPTIEQSVTSFATCLWLLCNVCHTGKKTVNARIKSSQHLYFIFSGNF